MVAASEGKGVAERNALRRRHERLQRSGVPSRICSVVRNHSGTYQTVYQVRMHSLESGQITKVLPGGLTASGEAGDGGPAWMSESQKRGLIKAAVRSLYALGTDRGEVTITLLPERRYAVDSILPLERNEPVYQGTVKTGRFLMGMDPEFVLVDEKEEIVPASLFLERSGTAGCDAVRSGEEVTYPLAELRPGPQPTPGMLFMEMRKALAEAYRRIEDRRLKWLAGAMPAGGLALGGHIHFSGVPLSLDILKALDNYVALPLAVLEDPRGQKRRPRYGFLGDFRRQPYGGFEYRTLPSFLVSPLVARAALSMAALAVLNPDRLPNRPLDTEACHQAYYAGDKQQLRKHCKELHGHLAALPGYGEHAQVIDRLFAHISEGKSWNESRDIRPLWNITPVP